MSIISADMVCGSDFYLIKKNAEFTHFSKFRMSALQIAFRNTNNGKRISVGIPLNRSLHA